MDGSVGVLVTDVYVAATADYGLDYTAGDGCRGGNVVKRCKSANVQ